MKEKEFIESLKYYYEIDIDNCKMNTEDWIKELAKCMANPDKYTIQFLQELIAYKKFIKEEN